MSARELACVSWSDNPLAPFASSRAVEPGAAIGSLLPAGWESRRVICKYNGRWILRAGWACPVQAGDVVEFHELVEGRNGLRTVLSILVLVASIYTAGAANAAFGLTAAQTGAIYGAGISILGNLAINAFVPLEQQQGAQQQSPGSVYNVNVSGNQARVDQAIPVSYGRNLLKPDYAGEPYYVYDAAGDQYGYFVFCVGQGRYEIEQRLLGRTLIESLQDITVSRLLEPGERPTVALTTVVSSREVISLDLPAGRRVGGYAVCKPNSRVRSIGLDFVCPRGQAINIVVQIGVREIDDVGNGLTPWSVLATETISGDTSRPTRVSRLYNLSVPYRAEVRVSRITPHNDDPGTPNEIEWAALRGYLDADAELCPTASHYELVIRASEQLSGLSQNQFGLVAQRLLRIWTPEDGWSAAGAEVATRNPFHALMDLWTNSDYVNHPLPDERVDLATLHALAVQADARQDRCDIVFDSFISGWEAANAIAITGRSKPFRRNGVHTVARDELQTLTVTAFDSRSILPNSFSAAFSHPTTETADGVIAEYFDYRSWDWVEIECPAPGYTVTDPLDPRYNPALPPMSKPERKRYRGITGPKHAEREGLFDAAWPRYRRKVCSLATELQGMLPAFGREVLVAPAMAKYSQAGDVAFWTGGVPYLMGLSEPVRFEPGASHVISFTRDDGSLHPPIAVLPGPTEHEVYLASAPDFTLVVDDAYRERTRYQFGSVATYGQRMRVRNIAHQGVNEEGVQTYAVEAVKDDDRVHLVDNHLLPAPGELQDLPTPGTPTPGGGSGGAGEGGGIPVTLADNTAISEGPTDYWVSFVNDASIDSLRIYGSPGPGVTQWLSAFPVAPSIAAAYDIRFTLVAVDLGTPAAITGPMDTWLSLGTSRTLGFTGSTGYAVDPSVLPVTSSAEARAVARVRVEIRDAASLVLQGSAVWTLVELAPPYGGGE